MNQINFMQVHFLGATRTTTGSMYLLSVNDQQILLECGLFQGRREETIERNRSFSFDPSKLSAVVLSHAHIDHCGNLPNLVRQGFSGNIYSTFATRDLAAIMLADSAHIQQYDAKFVSASGPKRAWILCCLLFHQRCGTCCFAICRRELPAPHADCTRVTLSFADAGISWDRLRSFWTLSKVGDVFAIYVVTLVEGIAKFERSRAGFRCRLSADRKHLRQPSTRG